MSAGFIVSRNVTELEDAIGDITVAAASGGSNTPSALRRQRVLSGDVSALPFADRQAAIDSLPHHIPPGRTITVELGSGDLGPALFDGFHGGGFLDIVGAVMDATLATGPATGTAGTGTSSTALKNAANNWTAGDLKNRVVKLTVDGETHYRAIVDNTTDTAQIYALADLAVGDAFQILSVDSDLSPNADGDCLIVKDCSCQVRITAVKPVSPTNDGVRVERCADVLARALELSANAVRTFRARDCYRAELSDSVLSNAADALLEDCKIPIADRLVAVNGSVRIDGGRATVRIKATDTVANALKLVDCDSVLFALEANDCLATPLVAENCRSATAELLTGSNPDTPRGASISNAGRYVFTGADISGSDAQELLIEGEPVSWLYLSQQGSAGALGTVAYWGGLVDVLLRKVRIPPLGGDELTNEGDEILGGAHKHYGKSYKLGDAGGDPVAAAGTDQAGATEARYTFTIVTSGTGGVRLRASSFGVEYGAVLNFSGADINVYPPSGGTFNHDGLAMNEAIVLANGAALWWFYDGTYFYGV